MQFTVFGKQIKTFNQGIIQILTEKAHPVTIWGPSNFASDNSEYYYVISTDYGVSRQFSELLTCAQNYKLPKILKESP